MGDIKDWTIKNKLKLSEDKMEEMALWKLPALSRISRDSIVSVGCQIPFASKKKSIDVILDPALSTKQQINTVRRVCYFHIRQIDL